MKTRKQTIPNAPRATKLCRPVRLLPTMLVLTLSLALTACGKAPTGAASSGAGADASVATNAQGESAQQTAAPSDKPLVQVSGEYVGMSRDGADGFYLAQTPYFNEQQYLMYYDYNALEQRFVCTVSGCAHGDTACGAYLSNDALVVPFVVGDKLYCGYRPYPEIASEHVLEQRALDGTNPRVIVKSTEVEFSGDLYSDGDALYMTRNNYDAQSITRIDLATGALTRVDVPPLENYSWHGGSVGRTLLATRREQQQATATPTTLYATNVDDGTQTVLYEFPKEIQPCVMQNHLPIDGKLYGVNLETREITAFDLATRELSVVTNAFAAYGAPVKTDWTQEDANLQAMDAEILKQQKEQRSVTYPASNWVGVLADGWLYLYLDDETPQAQANARITPIKLACNLATGEEKRVLFTDFYNGYEHPMTVHAVTPHGLLVTQEHRRVKLSGTDENGVAQPYESEYEIFALIDSADFLNSVPNFRTIAPVQYGDASALS